MQFLKLISCSFQIPNFISNVISFLCLVSFPLGFARYSHERNHDIQDDESWKVGDFCGPVGGWLLPGFFDGT